MEIRFCAFSHGLQYTCVAVEMTLFPLNVGVFVMCAVLLVNPYPAKVENVVSS
jgi:hypothetical protein